MSEIKSNNMFVIPEYKPNYKKDTEPNFSVNNNTNKIEKDNTNIQPVVSKETDNIFRKETKKDKIYTKPIKKNKVNKTPIIDSTPIMSNKFYGKKTESPLSSDSLDTRLDNSDNDDSDNDVPVSILPQLSMGQLNGIKVHEPFDNNKIMVSTIYDDKYGKVNVIDINNINGELITFSEVDNFNSDLLDKEQREYLDNHVNLLNNLRENFVDLSNTISSAKLTHKKLVIDSLKTSCDDYNKYIPKLRGYIKTYDDMLFNLFNKINKYNTI